MWPVSCRPTYGPLLRFDVRARTSYNCRDPGSHQAAHDASCLRWLRPPPAGGAGQASSLVGADSGRSGHRVGPHARGRAAPTVGGRQARPEESPAADIVRESSPERAPAAGGLSHVISAAAAARALWRAKACTTRWVETQATAS
jgi:hypothetical protein